jgi:hypothetical protein
VADIGVIMKHGLTFRLPLSCGDSILLHDVDWRLYERVLRQVESYHVFVTYDGTDVEIMKPAAEHIRVSEAFARLIWILSEEQRINV